MLSGSTLKPSGRGGNGGGPTGLPLLSSGMVLPKGEPRGAGQGPFPAGRQCWRTSPARTSGQQELFAEKWGWMGPLLLPRSDCTGAALLLGCREAAGSQMGVVNVT